jgi:hypothetical protein
LPKTDALFRIHLTNIEYGRHILAVITPGFADRFQLLRTAAEAVLFGKSPNGGVSTREDLEVIEVSDLLAGVDVDKDGHFDPLQ